MIIRKAVAFDLYGTLVDVRVDEENLSFWDMLALDTFGSSGQVSGAELRERYARLGRDSAGLLVEGFMLDTLLAGLLASYGIDSTTKAVASFARRFRRRSLVRLEQKPYTDDLLRAIRAAGCRVGLVSNTEALLTNYDLEVLGLHDRFDALILSSRVGVKKPDRRIFELALGQLGTSAAQCVFVGDNPVDDIAGALAAGMDVIYLAADEMQPAVEDAGGRVVRAGFNLGEILAALVELGFGIS